MEYTDSVVVLRQVESGFAILGKSASGIARVESDGGVNRLFLSVINTKVLKNGEYFVYIIDSDNKPFCFSLGIRAEKLNTVILGGNFSNGFCCGVVYVLDFIPEVVCFSKTEKINFSLSDFKKCVALECLKKKTEIEKEKRATIKEDLDKLDEQAVALEEDVLTKPLSREIVAKYDDEAVATENYFDIENMQNECGSEKYDSVSNENGNVINRCKKEKVQDKENDFYEQLKAEHFECEKYCKERPYYDSAKKELDLLFSKFPPDDTLKKVFPYSKWVKIYYAEEKFYTVGVIYSDGEIKYVCYGVPGEYSPTPPKELEGFCSFIPLSVFELMGDGFWMMFQDAITGECVLKPKC